MSRRFFIFLALTIFLVSLVMIRLIRSNEGPKLPAELTSLEVLNKLTIADENPRSGYERELFKHWIDADKDCLNTRLEVLHRDSRSQVTGNCTAVVGVWNSWLEGKMSTSSKALQIDHLVSLAEAWDSGAALWNAELRRDYANDLGYKWSLGVTSPSFNKGKGDRDISEWSPRAIAVCPYVQRWMAVKYRWGLFIDIDEHDAIAGVLRGQCGSRKMILPEKIPGGSDSKQQDLEAGLMQPTTSLSSEGVSKGATSDKASIYPGAFCSLKGEAGTASNGKFYTCKRSTTDDRLRWRR